MSEEPKKSSYKIAGIVIAVLLILLALIVLTLSNLKVSKKSENTAKATSTEVTQTVSSTKSTTTNSATSVSSSSSKQTSSEKETTKATSDTQSLVRIVNENKLDYTSVDLSSTGVVVSKECYLQDNQVVYLINITIGAGATVQTVRYYCTYASYNAVSKDDILTVKYKQVSSSAFAVISVSK